MICDAHDSPLNKLTLPTSSKSPAARGLALTVAGRGRSGSPQLANNNATANNNTEK
jgi:hypothetical protein